MTGPSRKRARRGLPHIANARNGAVRLAERVIEGHLAADLAAPRPSSKAVGRSCPHAPYASNVEVAELGDVPAVHEVRAAAGAEAPVLVDEAPAVAALVLCGTYIINTFIVRPRGSEKATIRIASKAPPPEGVLYGTVANDFGGRLPKPFNPTQTKRHFRISLQKDSNPCICHKDLPSRKGKHLWTEGHS